MKKGTRAHYFKGRLANYLALLNIFLFLYPSGLWAANPDLSFGAEITVTNHELMEAERQFAPVSFGFSEDGRVKESRKAFFYSPTYEFYVKAIEKLWREEVSVTKSNWSIVDNETHRDFRRQIRLSGGLNLDLGVDVGVIEFPIGPYTLRQFQGFEVTIQKYLFELSKLIGLVPGDYIGGGHISVGYQSFGGNRLLIKNFIVDYMNHPELAMGAFGYNPQQALSHWMLPKACRSKVFQKLDALRVDNAYPETEFITDIEEILRPKCIGPFPKGNEFQDKHMALTFRNETGLLDDARFEFRSFRPQTSVNMLLRQIRLLQGRVNYLASMDDVIKLTNSPESLHVKRSDANLLVVPPIDWKKGNKDFIEYVEGSGEDINDHKDYSLPGLQIKTGACGDLFSKFKIWSKK